MSYILCIETSSKSCSVALAHRGVCVASVTSHMPREHARLLPQLCTYVLEAAHLSASKLHAVALSEGPGSFTGLRIGAAIAKSICLAANFPLISCSTLYVLARTWRSMVAQSTDFFLVLLPMKNHTFSYRLYDKNLDPLTKTHIGELQFSALVPYLRAGTLCVLGAESMEDWKKYLSHMQVYTVPHATLSAEHMCDYAYQKYMNKDFVSAYDFSPMYGREAIRTY